MTIESAKFEGLRPKTDISYNMCILEKKNTMAVSIERFGNCLVNAA